MDDALRFLELVGRELECEDAYFQLGHHAPSSADRLAVELEPNWWLVARFAAAPSEPEAKLARLAALVESFSGVTDELARHGAQLGSRFGVRRGPGAVHEVRGEVDEALALLADKAGALAAVVIDEDSPVLWGCAGDPIAHTDIDAAITLAELVDSAAAAELDLARLLVLDEPALAEQLADLESDKLRQRLLRKLPSVRERGPRHGPEQWAQHFSTCRAIAAIRRAPERHKAMQDDLGWLARDFGGIYHVILVFDGPFDELHATPPLQRALPVVEKLVLALPPIDPPPRSARVLRLL